MVNFNRRATGVGLGSLLVGLVLTGGMTHSAVAGETIKFHSQHINVGTKWDPTELSDEPGHISATFAAKGVGLRRVGPAEPPTRVTFGAVANTERTEPAVSAALADSPLRTEPHFLRSGPGRWRAGTLSAPQIIMGGPAASKV